MNIETTIGARQRTVSWLGAEYKVLVDREDSGGIVGLFESITPAGDGPPVHIHHNEDEVIGILDGACEFWLDGRIRRVAAGEAVFLPRGVPHTFRVTSRTPSRNIAVLTPGGFEGFFADVAAFDPRYTADAPGLAAVCRRYGLEFLGPAAWGG